MGDHEDIVQPRTSSADNQSQKIELAMSALRTELACVETQIAKLTVAKKVVKGKLLYFALLASMLEVGKSNLMRLEQEMQEGSADPKKASLFANTTLAAWRVTMGEQFFSNTVSAIPAHSVRLNDAEEAMSLFRTVADAIRKDLDSLE